MQKSHIYLLLIHIQLVLLHTHVQSVIIINQLYTPVRFKMGNPDKKTTPAPLVKLKASSFITIEIDDQQTTLMLCPEQTTEDDDELEIYNLEDIGFHKDASYAIARDPASHKIKIYPAGKTTDQPVQTEYASRKYQEISSAQASDCIIQIQKTYLKKREEAHQERAEIKAELEKKFYKEIIIPQAYKCILRKNPDANQSLLTMLLHHLWAGTIPEDNTQEKFCDFISKVRLHLLFGFATQELFIDSYIKDANVQHDGASKEAMALLRKLSQKWNPEKFETDSQKQLAQRVERILSSKICSVTKAIEPRLQEISTKLYKTYIDKKDLLSHYSADDFF